MKWLLLGLLLSSSAWALSKEVDLKKEAFGKRLRVGPLLLGSLLALGGAVGQAAGLVLSKKGMQDMDAFSATQIRIIAGVSSLLSKDGSTSLGH